MKGLNRYRGESLGHKYAECYKIQTSYIKGILNVIRYISNKLRGTYEV